jgi:hypothetical protein
MPDEWFRFDRKMNIKGSMFDDNIPAWMRISEEYGRGYKVIEQEEAKLAGMHEAFAYSDDTMNRGHCTLTPMEVQEIRSGKQSDRKLAKRFGLSVGSIGKIRRRDTYRDEVR